LEKHLTYKKKMMVMEPQNWGFKKKTVLVSEPLILKRYPLHGLECGEVDQGLWCRVLKFADAQGWNVVWVDSRIPFPKPNLAAIHGLRFNQEEKLIEFLNHNMSGMFDAPTRYGKAYLILNTIKAYEGVTTGVVVPGKDLGDQTFEFLQRNLGRSREVRMVGFGSRHKVPSEDVTIYSLASLEKADYGTPLLLLDEVHAIATNPRLESLRKFTKARRLGFGATTSGRYDLRDIEIEAFIGPVLTQVTYPEARALGAVDHLVVFMVEWPYDVTAYRTRDAIYKANLWQSKRVVRFLVKLFEQVIPPDWQTIGFIGTENSADFFAAEFSSTPTVAMAKKFTKDKERKAFLRQMQEAKITRCLASNIYSQGVTFSDLRVVINLMGGGANTYAIQKPGRVLEIRPGKRCGVLIDFMMRGVGDSAPDKGGGEAWCPHQDSKKRYALYVDKGYEVILVPDLDTLGRIFQEKCV